jgi:hypothetical protein
MVTIGKVSPVLQHGGHGPKYLHQQALYDYQTRREDVLFL